MATYCSPQCQKQHYRSHKKECDAIAQLEPTFRQHFNAQSLLAARIVVDLIERRGATDRFDELMALQTHADKFPMDDINKLAGVFVFGNTNKSLVNVCVCLHSCDFKVSEAAWRARRQVRFGAVHLGALCDALHQLDRHRRRGGAVDNRNRLVQRPLAAQSFVPTELRRRVSRYDGVAEAAEANRSR